MHAPSAAPGALLGMHGQLGDMQTYTRCGSLARARTSGGSAFPTLSSHSTAARPCAHAHTHARPYPQSHLHACNMTGRKTLEVRQTPKPGERSRPVRVLGFLGRAWPKVLCIRQFTQQPWLLAERSKSRLITMRIGAQSLRCAPGPFALPFKPRADSSRLWLMRGPAP